MLARFCGYSVSASEGREVKIQIRMEEIKDSIEHGEGNGDVEVISFLVDDLETEEDFMNLTIKFQSILQTVLLLTSCRTIIKS